MAPTKYVGVDGCKRGWFSVGFDSEGKYEFKVAKTFDKLLKHYKDADLILIDIPIGLPEGKCGRKCDSEARRKLGYPRQSSVFPTPTRQTVKQAAKSPNDHSGANYVEHQVAGKGISILAFNIAPKIAQVDEVMRAHRSNPIPKVSEVHPELCFWALKKGKPLKFGKKAKNRKGLDERLHILTCIESRSGEIYGEACSKYLRKDVARDDILDALAAAITAYCGYEHLQTLPKNPPKDRKGLSMEMVFWKPG